MINNRQAGRRRGRGGQQQRSQGNPGRQDNGNRIDNRARGNAAQLLEKYKSLAADAQRSGDRVNTEYYLQFADHYFRVLAETRSRQDEQRRQNGQAFEEEEEFDEDGEPVVRAERPQHQYRDQRGDGDGQQERGQERSQDRQDRAAPDREMQDRAPRGDENRGGNRYEARGDRQPRDDREDSAGGANARANGHDARNDTPAREQPPREAEAPRRGRRPRREEQDDAGDSFGADRLPPSLGISAVSANENDTDDTPEPAEKPRRRRIAKAAASDTPAAS
ncbi:MAG: DUF4167 domain-containing protein [Pseudomonadota bacterium]|nr:DUF4167 domain-containing protein [Pseudomonadota bacterium]